jgi:hypothetical protein
MAGAATSPFSVEELLMARKIWSLLVATLAGAALWAPAAQAAVTPQVKILFNGTLTGATYTLGPGELDNSFSFKANGSATVSGGIGDVPGDLDPTTPVNAGQVEGLGTTTGSGFFFNSSFLGLGPLNNDNWVSEAIVKLDVPTSSQPATFNHLLDVQGDLFFRFDSPPNKVTRLGFWDGTNEPTATAPNLSDAAYSHVALVWDATATSLTGYVNGVSVGVADGNAFEVPSPRVGFGFFSRFYNRAIDGKLDAVAFSTYSGAFNAATDFQLPVPEPTSAGLAALALAALPWLRRKG